MLHFCSIVLFFTQVMAAWDAHHFSDSTLTTSHQSAEKSAAMNTVAQFEQAISDGAVIQMYKATLKTVIGTVETQAQPMTVLSVALCICITATSEIVYKFKHKLKLRLVVDWQRCCMLQRDLFL